MSSKQILLFLIVSFLFACKAKKNIPVALPVKCKIDYKSAKTLTALLKQNQTTYETFSRKLKADITIDDKTTDFTIALRMKRDSIIWASISSFGYEAIKFTATKDSLKFIDRLNKRFYIGNYDTLSQMLKTEIDLEILQSLLIGNSVEFYEEDEKLRPGIDSCMYLLGTIRKRKLRKVIEKGKELREPAQNIWLVDNTFKITRILFREFESRREFDAHFTDFQPQETSDSVQQTVLIPQNLTYYIKSDKLIKVSLEGSKATINKPQTFPFTIPEGYELIEKK